MSKHILTSCFVNRENKDGKPYLTKDKKPFTKVVIKVAPDESNPQDYDGKYISCLSFNNNDACLGFQAGDEVDLKITEKDGFFNFKSPDRLDLLESRMAKAENDIKALNEFIVGDEPAKKELDKHFESKLPVLKEEEEELEIEPPF